MIIACPACATRYAVPDDAIAGRGRTVRCAKCRHSWFQASQSAEPLAVSPADDGGGRPLPVVAPAQAEPGLVAEPVVAPAAEAAPASDPAAGESEEPAPTSRIVLPPREHARTDEADAGEAHEPGDPYRQVALARPRRNWKRLAAAAAIVFAVLLAGLVGAGSYFGTPEWLPLGRATFAAEQPDLVLRFPAERQDRRTLANGTEFFGASGSVTNVGRVTRRVPPIRIVLRDQREEIVYSWDVSSPKAALAPGESVTINEAVTDVPASARFAEIGWKPG